MEIIMLTVKNLEKDMKDIVEMMPAQYAQILKTPKDFVLEDESTDHE